MSGPAGPDAEVVWRIVDGHAAYWSLAAAIETGALEAVAGGSTVGQVADALAIDGDRLVPVLEVLVSAGLLERSAEGYAATATTDGFLRDGSPVDLRSLVLGAPGRHESWLALAAAVGGAPPADPVEHDVEGFAVPLARSTFKVQHTLALRVVERLAGSLPDEPEIVEIAAGAAPWSVAFLEALPSARAICVDLPPLLDVAAEHLERHGCTERAELIPVGERHEVPARDADVVVLPHICRNLGATGAEDVIARAAARLAPGGHLILVDYLMDSPVEARARRAAALGVAMVANTTTGTAFPASRYDTWLRNAGMSDIVLVDGSPAPHDVLLCTRPDEPTRKGP